MKTHMRCSKWAFGLLAIVLGILLTLSFAPFDIFPLAILAPAGLLLLWLPATKKQAFWLGFLFGMGLFGSGIYWVFHSIHNIGGVPAPIALFITGGFVAILALFPAITGYLLNRYFPINNPQKILLAYPACWVALEWTRSWIFTGFPWLFVGYSQSNSPLKGYAPLLSVYGVSLAVIFSSALLVQAYRTYKQQQFRALYQNLLILVTVWVAGGLLSLIPWTEPNGKPLRVALVQGNIPQELKWSAEHLQLSFDRYQTLTEPLWGKTDLVIWPEAAIPLPMTEATPFLYAMSVKAERSHTALMLGIPIGSDDGRTYFNAIILAGTHQQYLKRHLVPYGEYTPLSALFARAMSFMNIPMSDMVAGAYHQTPFEVNNVKILPSICYEIAYPELIHFRDRDIGLLLTVTNDAWFGKSSAEAQHLQMAQMRAIEAGRPVLFVSNDGITAIIDAQGRIVESAPQRESYVLSSTVQPVHGLTPWLYNGIDAVLVILICLLVVAARQQALERKSTSKNTNKMSEQPT